MSQVKISGNASGTGIFTIASPNSNSNYTLTLPTATTTVVGTDATQAFTNKSFDSASVPTVSGTAPLYFCRAWVNFNGTGTVAIRASANVSSITDNGTGDYTINFTTALPDINYSMVGCSYWSASDVLVPSLYESGLTTRTASAIRIRTTYIFSGITLYDGAFNNVAIFR